MSDADVKMPPLPEPDGWIGANDIDPDAGSEGYSMPTLQAYARAAVLAERERCAKLADEYATWGGSNFAEWFRKCAAAIREGGNE